MKKDLLEVGKTYTNGRGRSRKIIDRGPQYTLYPGQADCDTVLLEIVAGPGTGTKRTMTAAAFASWAKEEASHEAE